MSEQEFTLKALRQKLIQDHNEVLKNLDKHKTTFDAVLLAMPNNAVTRIFCDWYHLYIQTSGDLHTLAACIRALRIQGFSTNYKPKPKETSYNATFTHRLADGTFTGARVTLDFTSTACRRVKVGTKLVEQDVYETVCDEHTYPASA